MAIRDLSTTLRTIEKFPRHLVAETRWLALSGGPTAGKSTIVAELDRRGHPVRREQARQYMETQLALGRSLQDLTTDSERLSREIFERNNAVARATNVDDKVVFDRALPDVLAFSLVDGVDVEPFVSDCARYRFAAALVFEHVPMRRDHLVYHSRSQIDEAIRICEAIYRKLSTRVLRVPAILQNGDEWISLKAALVEGELRLVP
jgi:predicted ATPase